MEYLVSLFSITHFVQISFCVLATLGCFFLRRLFCRKKYNPQKTLFDGNYDAVEVGLLSEQEEWK